MNSLRDLITCRVCDVYIQNKKLEPGEQGARCFPIVGERSPFQSSLEEHFGISLSEEAETVDSPILDEIYSWHLNGGAPSSISRSGDICLYVQFAFQVIGKPTLGWCCDCVALDLDIDKGDSGPNFQRMKKIQALFLDMGIEVYWNFSRSYGLHLWFPFEYPIQQHLSYQSALSLKSLLIQNGIVDEEDSAKIETRPLKVITISSNETSRLSLPNNRIYPHMQLMSIADLNTPIAANQAITKNSRASIDRILQLGLKEKKKPKATKSTQEIKDEVAKRAEANFRRAYGAKEEWKRVDLIVPEDWVSPREIEDINIQNLPACVQYKIYNDIKITDGWNNELYNIALSLWASYGLDAEFNNLLDKHVRLMNYLDGENRPQDHGFYRPHFESARNKLMSGGTSLTCQETPSMCEYCDSVRCARVSGGYNSVRGVMKDTGIKGDAIIYRVIFPDPLIQYNQTHIFPKGWMKPDFDADKIMRNGALSDFIITMRASDMLKMEKFMMGFSENPNHVYYDYIERIEEMPSRMFHQTLMAYTSKEPLVVDKPVYAGVFCSRLGMMSARIYPRTRNPNTFMSDGFQIGVSDGTRKVYILSNLINTVLSGITKRFPPKAEEFYMTKLFDAVPVEFGWELKYDPFYIKVLHGGPMVEYYERAFEGMTKRDVSELHRR